MKNPEDGLKSPFLAHTQFPCQRKPKLDQYKARKEKLIVSKNPDGTEVKYPLCNDRQKRYTDSELLYMQMQRYWTERSLQDAKSELGMAEYQVRTWTAWHHHISLTMPALLFMI